MLEATQDAAHLVLPGRCVAEAASDDATARPAVVAQLAEDLPVEVLEDRGAVYDEDATTAARVAM